jgi:O-6-methylguanine DNA methyltransferase
MPNAPDACILSRPRTPIGDMLAVVDTQGALALLEFADCPDRWRPYLSRFDKPVEGKCPSRLSRLLNDYFEGDIAAVDGLQTAAAGTDFQQALWRKLRRIPSGTTTTYGALAKLLGRPGAARAVGLANGANPIAVVVPCHRVVGCDGSLTGYGGGLERKRWLIAHEARHANRRRK